MPRPKLTDEQGETLDWVVEQVDDYKWPKEPVGDLVDALEDIDMREHDSDNPVEVLLESKQQGSVKPIEYDPDAEMDGWMDSATIRRILASQTEPRINPEHVEGSTLPRNRADKRDLLAAMIRFTYGEKVHVNQIKNFVEREFGGSDSMSGYVDDIKSQNFWEGEAWNMVTVARRAAVSMRSEIIKLGEVVADGGRVEYERVGELSLRVERIVSGFEKGDNDMIDELRYEWNAIVHMLGANYPLQTSKNELFIRTY